MHEAVNPPTQVVDRSILHAYALDLRSSLESHQVLLKIAQDQEDHGMPASPIKRKLSTRKLLEALGAQTSSRLDRRYGVKGLPLLSLEELVCLVLAVAVSTFRLPTGHSKVTTQAQT